MEAILKVLVTSNVYGEQGAGSRCAHSCFLLHICWASLLERLPPTFYTSWATPNTQSMISFLHSLHTPTLMLPWVMFLKLWIQMNCSLFLTAVLEVYIHCGYQAYLLLSIDYEEGDGLDDGDLPTAVTWRFNLGCPHSPLATPRLNSKWVFASLSVASKLTCEQRPKSSKIC